MGKSGQQGLLDYLASQIPLGHVGETSDVAKAVLILASDDSSFVNGAELFVDGGLAQVQACSRWARRRGRRAALTRLVGGSGQRTGGTASSGFSGGKLGLLTGSSWPVCRHCRTRP